MNDWVAVDQVTHFLDRQSCKGDEVQRSVRHDEYNFGALQIIAKRIPYALPQCSTSGSIILLSFVARTRTQDARCLLAPAADQRIDATCCSEGHCGHIDAARAHHECKIRGSSSRDSNSFLPFDKRCAVVAHERYQG